MISKTLQTLVVLFCVLSISDMHKNWRYDRKPQAFGNKIPSTALIPRSSKVIKKIVLYHNFFRTKVRPKASNMLSMKWHNGAAAAAQRWADSCRLLVHDPPTGRHIEEYGTCGQNIFVSSHQVPWLFAIKTWFLEHQNFTYASRNNDLKVIGHYTQMVWATTHEVGCGFAKCASGGMRGKPFFNYVCNYCPIGNWAEKLGRPYRRGKQCGLCPKACRLGKLCTNPCPYADQWSNCKELLSAGRGWLCGTSTPNGRTRLKHCRATCQCKNQIHEWR